MFTVLRRLTAVHNEVNIKVFFQINCAQCSMPVLSGHLLVMILLYLYSEIDCCFQQKCPLLHLKGHIYIKHFIAKIIQHLKIFNYQAQPAECAKLTARDQMDVILCVVDVDMTELKQSNRTNDTKDDKN